MLVIIDLPKLHFVDYGLDDMQYQALQLLDTKGSLIDVSQK